MLDGGLATIVVLLDVVAGIDGLTDLDGWRPESPIGWGEIVIAVLGALHSSRRAFTN